ncbi:MAG: PEP-CTERM sorting domain-containing protein, partial [Planctomycetales bacterium]|nr:PEP-CTERM sorting domain-containing protein [Planctomycetales bacterium]
FVGLVPDLARQFVGRMDEFYLFTRAITAEEVQTLYGLEDPFTPGDYNQNGVLDAADLNLQAAEIGGNNAAFDLNSDGSVDFDDRLAWVKDLKNTWVGDSNLDGEFNSGDFVQVFTAGLFESGAAATWEQGDWNGDEKFDSGDFVSAFTDGGFELGPRTGVSAVPEPSSLGWLAGLGVLMALRRRR